jgi:predicted metal-dependent phosphoesterase TrpH
MSPRPFRWLIAIALGAALFLLGQVRHLSAQDNGAIPARPQPRWWKGNLHTHTLWSDGDDFPEMIAEWYRTRGYNFLGLTDHNVLSQGMRWMRAVAIEKRGGTTVVPKYLARFGSDWVESRSTDGGLEYRLKPLDEFRALVEERGQFIMIPCEELSDAAEHVPVHINATNVRDVIEPLGGATVREAIENNLRSIEEQAKKAGREILAHLNHPNFGWAVTAEDIAHAVTDRFFEVYNGHPGVNQPGDEHRPSIDRMWDIANTIRLVDLKAAPLYGIATDDSHSYHGKPSAAHPGRGWTMVRSTHLTPEYILKAIKAGDCYASSGVTLADVRYDRDNRLLSLAIEPVPGVTYKTQFIGTLRSIDTTSQPTLDANGQPPKDAKGKLLRVSRRYSSEIGKVLAEVEGTAPQYRLQGNELYVRAVVIASVPPADPSFAGQMQQAWTQPVGWEWLDAKGAADSSR